MCNIYKKSVRSQNDHAISAYKGINILLDYSNFDQIKRLNIPDSKCKTEPGITLDKLNSQLLPFNFYVPYITPGLNENPQEIQLDQAVQENRICLQSLKYGHFKDQALERVSFVSGEGRMIQTGGYKVRDTQSFGFNVTDLFSGSNYTIGLLFEVVVNCFKQKHNHQGHIYELKLRDSAEISKIARNFKDYVEMKDEKQQSVVDAVIISNLNSTDKTISLKSFDFNLNSQSSIKDIQSFATKDIKSIISQQTNTTILDADFVSKFAFTSQQNRQVDQEIVLTVSLGNGIFFLNEYKEMFDEFPYQIHFQKKYINIKLCFDSNDEDQKIHLDRITSEVIKIGGTLKASRKVLSMISPYLDKRILGNYNMKVHNGLKQIFDPKDVLNPSSFFYLREKQDKSAIKRLMDKNKQINFMLSK
eukprot:403365660